MYYLIQESLTPCGAAEIPLDSLGAVDAVRAVYPSGGDCEYRVRTACCRSKFPRTPARGCLKSNIGDRARRRIGRGSGGGLH